MGMFDSVIVKCPADKCEGEIEFQSKAGPCHLERHSVFEVPLAIAADINGEHASCKKCGQSVMITIPLSTPSHIAMKVQS